ncbi:MAG: hypothetical protein SCARUB_04110 [Candidatus Scalindua rubra]|uniref:Uncharacterized protein n=1 Tax=Candidatus Scalindua rubra TaxID=1872076 RepID=A0A1E3X581_9BACT|nr:MAG: hypothetical protein SCARUB_04110 [Candidatus Scalindua rubra]
MKVKYKMCCKALICRKLCGARLTTKKIFFATFFNIVMYVKGVEQNNYFFPPNIFQLHDKSKSPSNLNLLSNSTLKS